MRVQGRDGRVTGRWRTPWCAVLAGAVLLAGVGPAGAAFDTPACLAKKLKEWGKLRKCQAIENGKVLRGLPADVAKCTTKHGAKLAAINGQATAAAIACRFGDNGDGTVTDYDTGLQWEQKTDDGGLHDTDNHYNWSAGSYLPDFTAADGDAFVYFLASLNDCASNDNGATLTGGFAGHCDWRIPTLVELLGMADPGAPGCGTLSGHCIDESVFGPVHLLPNSPSYWSSTINPPTIAFPNYAWGVDFRLASPFITPRSSGLELRAVRSAL